MFSSALNTHLTTAPPLRRNKFLEKSKKILHWQTLKFDISKGNAKTRSFKIFWERRISVETINIDHNLL